jgi:hypothetical protein
VLEVWGVTGDPGIREALLRDPSAAVPAHHGPAVSPPGPTARGARSASTRPSRAVAALLALDRTSFVDPDRRILEACQRRLAAQVARLARTGKEETAASG